MLATRGHAVPARRWRVCGNAPVSPSASHYSRSTAMKALPLLLLVALAAPALAQSPNATDLGSYYRGGRLVR